MTAAVVGYVWWTGGLRQFEPTAYLAVSLPVGAVFVLVVSRARWPHGARSAFQRASLSWAALLFAAASLEVAALALGGRNPQWPTFSTAADHLLGSHVSRAALIALWVVVGALFARPIGEIPEYGTSGARVTEPGYLTWIALGAVAIATEVIALVRRRPAARLRAFLAPVVGHPIGRLVLFACWAFLGFHFFARSGIAP